MLRNHLRTLLNGLFCSITQYKVKCAAFILNCKARVDVQRFYIYFLSFGVLLFFMLSSVIEELLFKGNKKVNYPWFISAVELLQFSFFSLFEALLFKNYEIFKGVSIEKVKMYALISFAMICSKGLTYIGMAYVNYPTLVIIKSLKLLSIILVGYLVMHNKPDLLELIASICLVVSCILFVLGDIKTYPDYRFLGVVTLFVSIIADAYHTNWQEKALKIGCSVRQVMLICNFLASFFTFWISFFFQKELSNAINFCNSHPSVYLMLTLRSLVMYLGAVCFVTLIKYYGSVLAATVSTVRKILTVILSFFVVSKPFTIKYVYAMMFFIVGAFIDVINKKYKKGKK